jgi:hypothetical protein
MLRTNPAKVQVDSSLQYQSASEQMLKRLSG